MKDLTQKERSGSGPAWRRLLFHLAAFGLLWAVLEGASAPGWVVGGPVVVAAAAWATSGRGRPSWAWRPGGAAAFVPFFLLQSIASGLDVAARALRPDMRLHPGLLRYAVSLPEGTPRNLFIHTITLMPGTLSTRLDGDELLVHLLDSRQDALGSLRQLEQRVGACFDLEFAVT
jgi:multicomponent Na+:H+ antiporter subunit E